MSSIERFVGPNWGIKSFLDCENTKYDAQTNLESHNWRILKLQKKVYI
ncbi:hypothetical protein [Bacteroidetes bacterium endosymbiont of Geopemphigus sp.]|nr:hypothetical protein [Bacteroidetes bacterium endosymbiont of Geopemphigus sp.]